MNSRQPQSIEEEVRFRLKHQTLLQEFLELQKDFVSKKEKMQITEKKRDALLAEVRFLRQKHSFLMDLHSNNIQSKKGFLSPEKQNENVGKSLKMVKKIKDRVTSNKRINKV